MTDYSSRPDRRRTEIDDALAACRVAATTVAVMSLVINMLMLTAPVYMLLVMGKVLLTGSVETLLFLTIMAAVAMLVMSLLDTFRNSVTVRVGCWLNMRLSPVFVESGVRAQLRGDASGPQSLRDISQIQSFIATQGLSAFFDSPWVPFFVVVIWILHPVLGMVSLGAAIILLALSIANDRVTRRPSNDAGRAQIEAQSLADATIRNAEVVTAMGLLPAMLERWRSVNARAVEGLRVAGEAGGIVLSLTKFVRSFVQTLILGVGAWLVVKNELSAGAMIAASILLGRALAPVELAIGAWKSFVQARQAYIRLKDHAVAYPPPLPRMLMLAPQGRVDVSGLSFLAPGSLTPILDNVSFSVSPGEALAVIGPSGAGKSTLCRLLVGLSDPVAGDVRLDGTDVRHWNRQQFGRAIGFLPQDVELFAGTVRENIARMGEAEDVDVIAAATTACAHNLIQCFPHGYDTRIGDGGVRLSGGQRQRVGLARAIFGDPRLIVLDEPNANLDQAGESALADAIGHLKSRGCALIIVGHRPSTLAKADKILLLQRGHVAMLGPRDEILRALTEQASRSEGEQEQRTSVSMDSKHADSKRRGVES